jgi:hypothetical protein
MLQNSSQALRVVLVKYSKFATPVLVSDYRLASAGLERRRTKDIASERLAHEGLRIGRHER